MSLTMGGEDADSLEFERLNDLYVVDNLTLPNMEEMPDIFSPDAPPIDDSPEATAAFDSFVNELDGTAAAQTNSVLTTSPGSGFGSVTATVSTSTASQIMLQANSTISAAGPLSSSTSYSSALSTHPQAQHQLAMTAEDYPDRLDLRALGTHAIPLNVAADASLHAATATRSSTPYNNLLPDSDALTAHLALPLGARSWSASQPTSTRLDDTTLVPQVPGIPPVHSLPVHQTAANRGRPRVREMKHLGARSGASVGVGAGNGAPSAAKLRYSKGAAPSKYCHVCGRSAKTVSVALCGNNQLGLCRKVVCDKCLLMHQRDSWEVAKRAGAGWICMHCRNLCPERARCHQYQRNNLKRRMRAAAPPTPHNSNPNNLRRSATGRVVKGIRATANAATAARRTAAAAAAAEAAEAASTALGASMSPDAMVGLAHTGVEFGVELNQQLRGNNVPDFQVTEVAQIQLPQMGTQTRFLTSTEISDHPITAAELDEHENRIRVRNPDHFSNEVKMNNSKSERRLVSLHSTPAKEIVDSVKNEHMNDSDQSQLDCKQEPTIHNEHQRTDGAVDASRSMEVSPASTSGRKPDSDDASATQLHGGNDNNPMAVIKDEDQLMNAQGNENESTDATAVAADASPKTATTDGVEKKQSA